MRCRDVRIAQFDHDLGALDAGAASALRLHRDRCARCRETLREDDALTADLRTLAAVRLPEIDVRARVLHEIRRFEPLDRAAVPGRQLAWALALAGVLIVALAAGTMAQLPLLGEGLRDLWTLTSGLAAAAYAVGRQVVSLVAIPLGLLGKLPELLDPLAGAYARWRPLGQSLIATTFLATLAISTWIVVRDLRHGRTTGVRTGRGSSR